MWCLPDDRSKAVITAAEQVHCGGHECRMNLPETAIVFFMSKGTDYLAARYDAVELPEPFPRFLNRCPIWEIPEWKLCFLDGGRGAGGGYRGDACRAGGSKHHRGGNVRRF